MPQVHLLETIEQASGVVFRKLYPIEDNATLVVNAHLLVEALLYRFIQSKVPSPRFIDNARFTFSDIHYLARAMREEKETENWFWNVTRQLNSIRNTVVHSIEVEDLGDRIDRLMDLAENRIYIHAPGADSEEREQKRLQLFLIILCAVANNLADDSFQV